MELLLATEFEKEKINFFLDVSEVVMDMEQLRKAAGFKNEVRLKELLATHPELLEKEYSYKKKVPNLEGGVTKMREKRFFTESGIYEVTFLASTPRAREFRRFASTILKSVRKGEMIPKLPADRWNLMEEKFNKITNLFEERQEQLENLDENAEKIINLLEELKLKFIKFDNLEADVKELKKKVTLITESMDDFLEALGEEE
ncbi:BRO-N domain-containing protein [Fusobacterium sp. THCT1E2]